MNVQFGALLLCHPLSKLYGVRLRLENTRSTRGARFSDAPATIRIRCYVPGFAHHTLWANNSTMTEIVYSAAVLAPAPAAPYRFSI
jgi:hypothetical protein